MYKTYNYLLFNNKVDFQTSLLEDMIAWNGTIEVEVSLEVIQGADFLFEGFLQSMFWT